MSLLEGWIVESAMLGHAPSIGDLAVWEIAFGRARDSSVPADHAGTKPLERKRTLSVSLNGRSMVLRGELSRLPQAGEAVRMLGVLYARLDSARPEYGGERWYSIECVGETYRATPN
jgi:hypothetical protein